MIFLSQFAAETTTAEEGIFSALGIDWRLMILQIIAFLILVVLLGKFVYPWLMKSVDERQASIDATTKATAEAQKSAEDNKAAVAKLLAQARKEANEIIGTAKLESAAIISGSEEKAAAVAKRITKDAHEQIDKDIVNARKVLYNDTLELVGLATEKIIATKLDQKSDNELIASVVKAIK